MRQCPRCGHTVWWKFSTGQSRCKNCKLTRNFTRTYWNKTRISSYWKGRLLELFVLGVPAFRLRFQVPISSKTVQRWFRLFRLVIYQSTLKELETLSGTLEMDETMFGGRVPEREAGALREKTWSLASTRETGKYSLSPSPVELETL